MFVEPWDGVSVVLRVENWAEYDSLADWCARKGLTGEEGTYLPPFVSTHVLRAINSDVEAFARRVKECAYAIAMNRHNLPGG